jgi:GntR family transcriptional regulator/MocR family aminotransferase
MQFTLRPDLPGPLYRQLFESLRLAILEGVWRAGQRLPPSRELAQQLVLSRNTVVTAYDMLRAEGYLAARRGSGHFVAAHLPDSEPAPVGNSALGSADSRVGLSDLGQILAAPSRPVPSIDNPAFVPGLPDLGEFPARQWQQCLQRYTGKRAASVTGYQDRGGHLHFKRALCDYLRMSRGLRCSPEQVIAVSGSQAGLDLLARMLINPGDAVAVENPGYLGARDSFRATGAQLHGIAVDSEGLSVDELSAVPSVKLVYTTPSYQFPLGVTMSAARRLQLINWAVNRQGFVIEDDYDCEFRYRERPLSSLQGMDQQQRVIYLGTFSKVMFPGLRLGYLVVPARWSSAFALALRKTGQEPPLFLQAAMADFIRNGYFASHMRRMRKLYGENNKCSPR